MTEHAQVVWGYAGAETLARINGQQGGWRTGRQYPIAPSEAGDNQTIRPYTLPWTKASDSFGVSYPAGTLAVVESMSLPSPLVSTLNADFESQWSSLATTVYAVPGVLPVGYTANLYDGWHSSTANLARRRTASGYTDATWLPDSSVNGLLVQWDNWSFSGTDSKALGGAKTGFRKVQFRLWIAGTIPPPAWNSGTVDFSVSHNADGSSPPSTGGDTVDATLTVDHSEMAFDGSSQFTTPWYDLGAVSATLGTMSHFIAYANRLGNPFAIFNIDVRCSARCDVPFPLSVHGYGDLIAPGGYP